MYQLIILLKHLNRRTLYSLFALIYLLAISIAQAQDVPEEVVVSISGYPRVIERPEGTVVVQMPQVESWEDYETLVGWTVVEVTPTETDRTWVGSVKFSASSDIDFDERLVIIHEIELVDRKFDYDDEPPASVIDLARDAISFDPKSVPLDVVLRALPEDFEVGDTERPNTPQLKLEAPEIYVSTSPAVLMIIDGEPVNAPIESTGLEFVVNTNWDLIYDTKSKCYYVLNDGVWQRAESLTNPKWKTISKLPSVFEQIPQTENWETVREYIPPVKSNTKPATLLVSLQPAELILLDGEATFSEFENTGLEWVSNSESDLFRYQGRHYYLVSGRWFEAENIEGPWQVVESLPEVFAGIPEEHSKAHVLASVPGTESARSAVIEANIPRKASISIDAGKDIDVVYDGEPKFVLIEGTRMQRAANTQDQVLLVDGKYYLCQYAVWFSSATPTGPWQVEKNIPDVVYDIPASDPAHNVTYVYVYEEAEPTVSTHVSFGYTGGYYGYYPYGYSSGFSLVFGTGWYYPPYYYYSPFGYPSYWHYPTTYGYGSRYNPATGRYAERAVAYGPYGGAAATAVYNPRTRTYGRGAAVWDNDEIARSGYAYNPNSRTYAAGNMYYDFDDQQGGREAFVQRENNWVYADSQVNEYNVRTEFETSRGTEGTIDRNRDGTLNRSTSIDGAAGGSIESRVNQEGRSTLGQSSNGDLYAGKNGSVYKRNDRGDWSQYQSGSWNNVPSAQPTTTPSTAPSTAPSTTNNYSSSYDRSQIDLNRQYNARQYGGSNYNQYQNMGGSRGRAGGFRGRRR